MRERRRYVAVMPESAWPHGRPPRERTSRKRAVEDLAAGLGRYLAKLAAGPEWAVWAATVVYPHLPTPNAPDGTRWGITTRVDYL